MTVTTIAFHRVARDVWGWSALRAGLLTTAFLILDMAFLLSTITKIFDGGWVPVLLAALALIIMLVWRSGQRILADHVAHNALSWSALAESLASGTIARTPGEGVVLASHPDQVPQALAASIRLVRAVPERLIIITIRTLPVPIVAADARLTVTMPSNGIRQVVADVGFTELPSVPELLATLQSSGAPLVRTLSPDAADATLQPISHTEASFRYALNEDAMATEKLAEGIRAFAVDAGKLDALILAL